ncbi:histidine phosphatase family protein [Glycomyces sp. L485]|uniref:histidine phosphatase family protein n=1 Tax=Glycomyces sp. L485 TaxID=2909235 RepID=UPI001F4AE25A|nr:histidine phosphatase family protein [Glycomyces sp. L485]
MRTLYVITHPEASHHVEGLIGGWHDSQLTPDGIRAAHSIGQALLADVPDGAEVELFSSDLRRTAQTAEVIAEWFDVRPVLDPRLREMSFGQAEGRPHEEWDRLVVPPPAVGERMEHTDVPGAESKATVAQRIYAAMDEILHRPCEHQVIVTHGFALTFVVAAWIKMPIASLGHVVFKAPSGSITKLCEDDFYRGRMVVRLGETRHLDRAAAR